MRRDFLVGIGLLASVAAGAGSAVAADMPVRPGVAPAAVAPVFVPDWVGFYVGIHGGGGWGRESFDQSVSNCSDPATSPSCVFTAFTLPPSVDPKGGVFGFQFGHNWQWGPVVGGLEIDYSGADIHGSSTFTVFDKLNDPNTLTTDKKIDSLASARGRLGYLIWPNFLLYGTAGIGWGHERITTTFTQVNHLTGNLDDEENAISHVNMFGWVAGVGLEWKFWPGSNSWLLRGEWLHYDFGKVTNSTSNPFFVASDFPIDLGNVRTTVDVARAALSYKF
jgi:opacity protein-like surface antigen